MQQDSVDCLVATIIKVWIEWYWVELGKRTDERIAILRVMLSANEWYVKFSLYQTQTLKQLYQGWHCSRSQVWPYKFWFGSLTSRKHRKWDCINMSDEPSYLQVATMQQRLNCAWRYVSYHAEFGRATETLMCALRHRTYGPDSIWPIMDWETCTLSCGLSEDLDHEQIDAQPMRMSMSSYGHRMHWLNAHRSRRRHRKSPVSGSSLRARIWYCTSFAMYER